MGVISTDPNVRLNATFAPIPPLAGSIGFMSQSGGLGLAIMDYAGALGLGLSTFVSVGNKSDISGNDLITYWEQDPRTNLILLTSSRLVIRANSRESHEEWHAPNRSSQ